MKDYTKTKEYKGIKNALNKYLEDTNNNNPYFSGLVEDYMDLWVIKNQLRDDIKERGVVCKYQNGETQWGYKRNDSVGELNKVSSQMLKILSQLKIEPNKLKPIEEDDEL